MIVYTHGASSSVFAVVLTVIRAGGGHRQHQHQHQEAGVDLHRQWSGWILDMVTGKCLRNVTHSVRKLSVCLQHTEIAKFSRIP